MVTSTCHKFLPNGCVPKLTHFLGSPLVKPTSCSGFDFVCLCVCVWAGGGGCCVLSLFLSHKRSIL